MIVNTDTLQAIRTNFRAIFNQTLSASAPSFQDYTKISTYFPSETEIESYNWLGEAPSLQEWVDERQQKSLNAYNYSLQNKHYEGTIGVDRDSIEDNKILQYSVRIRGLANAALRYFNELVFKQLDGALSLSSTYGKAFDGAAFFGNSRTIGKSAAIANYIQGAYSDSTDEILAGFAAALTKMREFQDDWGKPLNLVPDTIVCSPEMELPIKRALIPAVALTVRPEMAYIKQIISNPWLTYNSGLDWYVVCTTCEVLPMIFQMRKSPEFDALENPNDSYVFLKKKFLYGVDTRFAVGYGDPRTIVMVRDSG